MQYKEHIKKIKGIGLIEVVVGVSILSLSLLAISSFYQKSLNISSKTAKLTQASFLLEEGLEIARFLRDEDWQNISNLTTGVDYYVVFNGSKWATTTTVTFIDGVFERKLNISNVSRDSNDVIVSSGGTVDSNIKKITSSVSWRDGNATTTRTLSTYLTNLFAG